MIVFVDENIPKRVVNYLSSRGHEVIDIRSTGLEGTSDFILFTEAQQRKAIFITTDRDFFTTIPFQFDVHHGIIVVSLKQPNAGAILARITWAFENLPVYNLDSSVILLKDTQYSVYRK
jgi:predicted nuclease of predicted toxin-antitoxin system